MYNKEPIMRLPNVCLLIATLLPLTAGAEMYRWQDENGNWQFSDKPPAEGGHDTIEVTQPQKIGQDDAVRQINERALRLLQSQQQQRDEELAQEQAERQRMVEPCNKARAHLRKLHRPFVYIDEQGNRKSVSAEQVRADIAKTQAWITENCSD